jgi:hypothetical protein
MKKIAFYLPHIDIQGTGVSLFDYCNFNQTILGNKSYMIYDVNHEANHPMAIEKFKKNNIDLIPLNGREDQKELEKALEYLDVDAVYIQKTGKKDDGRFAKNKPTFIHCIGVKNEPHGTVYAYASEWLSYVCSDNKIPVVPYMVHLPEHDENFRQKLNIPENATVFGRTGGYYSWNIPWVSDVICDVLQERKDLYFLFVQTHKFIDHERVLFCDSFADLHVKRKFINTCDAMIHARAEGESFGLACGEFSLCNKPVVTYEHSPEKNHIFTLKDKGIYYNSPENLKHIFLNFKKEDSKNWNAYEKFSPNNVIQQFNKVFIDKL